MGDPSLPLDWWRDPDWESGVKQLIEMGFPQEKSIDALEAASGDVSKAAVLLLPQEQVDTEKVSVCTVLVKRCEMGLQG